MSPFRAGLIAIVVVAIASYLAFAKHIPFVTHHYQLKAVFQNATNLRTKSPVRIAGVDSGSTIPVTQTSAPVQIDQVLSSLQSNTRENLQLLLTGYGSALDGKPLPGEDADQVPQVRGLTAAQALNRSLDYSPQALRGTALVNQGFLGEDPHDLSKLVAATQKVSAALNANEGVLQDFITNFNRTMAAFAAQQTNLQQSVHLLGPVLTKAHSALLHLNQSFPPTRAWAREILPGVHETPATI